jgi:hypothetical protein
MVRGQTIQKQSLLPHPSAIAASVVVVTFFVALVALVVTNVESKAVFSTVITHSKTSEAGKVTKTVDTKVKTTPAPDESFLGRAMAPAAAPILLDVLLAGLGAFLLGAVVQRVLIGDYAFTIGPITVPDVPAVDEATVNAVADRITSAPTISIHLPDARHPQPLPSFLGITDERLAVVTIRVELAQALQKVAATAGLYRYVAAERLPDQLLGKGILDDAAAKGLTEMLVLGDRVLNGADIDKAAVETYKDQGLNVIYALDEIATIRGAG